MLAVDTFDGVQSVRGTLSFFGSPLKACFFVVDGLMIDTGPLSLARETIPFLRDIPIEQLALTHNHEDHVGLSSWLIRSKGVRALIHNASVEATTRRKKLPWHRRYSWGTNPPFVSHPLPVRLERDKHTFEVIPTPGHTVDHVVFCEKEKGWLFTGDLFVSTNPVQWAPDESADKFITSLQRVLELDFDTVFCGHDGIRQNGKKLISQKLSYLRELRDKAVDLFNKGYSNRQIDRILFPKKPPSTYVTMGEWSSYHLINSLLESAGKIKNSTGKP